MRNKTIGTITNSAQARNAPIEPINMGDKMSPNKTIEAQIDAMIETDIDFSRESRWEAENPQLPEQIELFEEEI